MELRLYKPEKYLVSVGEPQSAEAICTVWNNPDALLRAQPSLLARTAIVGTLYSRGGVNAILRNLALNPHVRRVFIWAQGHHSQTATGKSGTEVLFALWEHGIEENGVVRSTSFKLEPEIPPDVVARITKGVELVDVSALNAAELSARVSGEQLTAYMDPVEIPPHEEQTPSIFPSEGVGLAARGKGIYETWIKVLAAVMRYGEEKGTQYGMRQQEVPGLTWTIETPEPSTQPWFPEDLPPELVKVIGASATNIAEYLPQITGATLPIGDVHYTYGSRLHSYRAHPDDPPHDQITGTIIAQLRNSPDTRRAVAVTYIPASDGPAKEPPCLVMVECLRSRGKLVLFAVLRSHDIFKAGLQNAYGLRALQEKIATAVGMETGALHITSISAHIYENDWDAASKLVRCAIFEREPEKLTGENTDPRGIVLIRIDRKKREIVVTVNGPQGEFLQELRDTSGLTLRNQLGHLNLLSQPTHWLDIGAEIEKAAIALKLGKEYQQDRPLEF